MLTRKTPAVIGAIFILSAITTARGATITLSNSQLDALIFNTAVYQVVVNNGSNLSISAFTAPVAGAGPEVLSSAGTSPVQLSGYSIPSGATLNSATLDLGALITTTQPLGYTMTGTGGTEGTWRPTFSSTSAVLFLTVSSGTGPGTTTLTLNAASVTGLDLMANGFSSHLLAGDPIRIAWNQTISIAASSTNYDHKTSGWKNATRNFHLSQTNSTSATGTLNIDYSTPPPPEPVPEPASFSFVAAGLLVLARFWRK
jgi:hypothetical protein